MQQSFRTGVQLPSPTPYQDVTFDKKVERRKSLFTGIFSFLCPFSGFEDAFGAVPTRSLTPCLYTKYFVLHPMHPCR